MEENQIDLGGFIIAPAQRVIYALLGIAMFGQGSIGLNSAHHLLFSMFQMGLGGMLIGLAIFPRQVERKYFLALSDKGIDGQVGYFKGIFIRWDEIKVTHLAAVEFVIENKSGKRVTVDLGALTVRDLREAKSRLSDWVNRKLPGSVAA